MIVILVPILEIENDAWQENHAEKARDMPWHIEGFQAMFCWISRRKCSAGIPVNKMGVSKVENRMEGRGRALSLSLSRALARDRRFLSAPISDK